MPSYCAVIVTVPAFFAVTTPVLLTDATAVLLDVHFTVPSAPFNTSVVFVPATMRLTVLFNPIVSAACAVRALENALTSLTGYTPELARSIREDEERCDHYEDIIGTYLVQLSSRSLSDSESQESTELLKTIGDFERISDHAVNVLESAEELQSKGLSFSPAAMAEYETLARSIREILHLSLDSFRQNDAARAARVEPLEQVIDKLKEEMRTRHILRMRQGQCSIEAGFVWADLLTDLERTSDHCSNIAGCVIDAARHNLNLHETLRAAQTQDPDFAGRFRDYAQTYRLPEGE